MEPIKEGELIPDCTLYEEFPTNKISIREIINEKRVVIIGFIGAFVPVCSRNFIPEYIERADALRGELNVTEILAIAVQDAFVLNAFNRCINKDGKIRMLADQDSTFVRAMGLSFDAAILASVRCKRFSMIAENGIVQEINIEPDCIGMTCTVAEQLGKEKPKKLAYPELVKSWAIAKEKAPPGPDIPSKGSVVKQSNESVKDESGGGSKAASPKNSSPKQADSGTQEEGKRGSNVSKRESNLSKRESNTPKRESNVG